MSDGSTKELDYKQLRNKINNIDNSYDVNNAESDNISKQYTANHENTDMDEQLEQSIKQLVKQETNIAKAEYYESNDFNAENIADGNSDENNKKKKNNASENKTSSAYKGLNSNPNSPQPNKSKEITNNKAKNKKNIVMGLTAVFLLIIIILCVVINNIINSKSYTYNYNKGKELKDQGSYQEAVEYLNKAYLMPEGNANVDVMTMLYECFDNMGNENDAVSMLVTIISVDNNNTTALKKLLDYYQETKDGVSINKLIDKYKNDSNKDVFNEYQPEKPQTSKDSGKYDEEIEIQLLSDGNDVYYTLDGTLPSQDSKMYTDAVVLEKGKSIIKCIAVNYIGVSSDIAEYEYEIEYKQPDVPKINPVSGTYAKGQVVVIDDIKEGCSVYYTIDESMPDTSSQLYQEPVELPEGNIVFSAITVDSHGLSSAVIKKNYIIQPEKKYTFEEAKQILSERMVHTGIIKAGTNMTNDGYEYSFIYQSKMNVNLSDDVNIDIFYIRMDIKKDNHTTTQGYYGVGVNNGITYKVDNKDGQYIISEY